MKHFSLNLRAISPLAIRSDHAPEGATSAAYISGTTLMGSLAAVHRLYYQDGTEQFEQLFLGEQVHYPNLYPATFKHKGMQNANKLPIYPLPKTAQSCKRFPGFFPIEGEEVDDPRHGVRDTLLDWAMFKLGKKANEADQVIDTSTLLSSLERNKKCPTPSCGKPMDHFTGFYRRSNLGGQPMMGASADTRLQTHTGINRDTGTVQEGILYNREVFEEQMLFWGMLKLPEDLAKTFGAFIDQVGQTGLVRVGTGRTRGLGKVHISVEPLEDEQQRFALFKKRLETFNEKLHEQAKATFKSMNIKPFYFALTLHSPTIQCDHLLRYRGTINEETLAELLDKPAHSFELIYQAASTRRITGWNELWGTPRTGEYAIDTGSVFLFASSVVPDDPFWRALFRLEEEGIGQRRAEGFGRVCLSDPFHLEVELHEP